ncbi:sialate O-acetylesterase [Mucilaginibacter jinjuensis]|uniref:Sialate O-acetylesterase n=1 Tax=Mucilaginibacter jinjuensis TaxID=1176721 RepID=A0ABY7TA52_9SPHI|nr:sialate O-acetylesterase [Mucilaginibacter jinjuensis]WCT13379.1 sialate O-acetylesterase [Mucilaginibacter jinjuensis]
MNIKISFFIGLFFAVVGLHVRASAHLPAIFGDNMILQRNMNIPVWGRALPGEHVIINFRQHSYQADADTNGKWTLKLGSYQAGGPYEMHIRDQTGETVFKNIWIGDVWVASGQSNMEFGIQTEQNGQETIARATDSLIHFFYVPMAYSLIPQDDILNPGSESLNGKWVVCSPKLLASSGWAWHGFSAAGYYFAQQIRIKLHCPVGMIGVYKGGTPAQAWISENGLSRKPSFNRYVEAHQKLIDNLDQAKKTYPNQVAAYQLAVKQWNTDFGDNFNQQIKQWDSIAAQAKILGKPAPAMPVPIHPRPIAPTPPEGGFGAPANLYNAMVAPVVPYGIKGVIWYQGEGNGDRLSDALEYKDLFPRLIEDWRDKWQQNKLPFLYVQLANYRAPAKTPAEGNWPWVREAQLKTLALPLTGMAVTTDIGNADNIHPLNKKDVGLRLALTARQVAYGEHIVASGPIYESMKAEGHTLRLIFKSTGGGLIADSVRHPGQKVLTGFGIAGNNGKFIWARAIIDGNSIVVSADEVPNPVAVRYNWADNPTGNLYNKEGLPASPFRTDNWDEQSAHMKSP